MLAEDRIVVDDGLLQDRPRLLVVTAARERLAEEPAVEGLRELSWRLALDQRVRGGEAPYGALGVPFPQARHPEAGEGLHVARLQLLEGDARERVGRLRVVPGEGLEARHRPLDGGSHRVLVLRGAARAIDEHHRARVPPASALERRRAEHDAGHLRVRHGGPSIDDGEGALHERPRFVEPTLPDERLPDRVDVQGGAPVIGAEALLGDVERDEEALLGLLEPAGGEGRLPAPPGRDDVAPLLP